MCEMLLELNKSCKWQTMKGTDILKISANPLHISYYIKFYLRINVTKFRHLHFLEFIVASAFRQVGFKSSSER